MTVLQHNLSVAELKGVGDALAAKLDKLGIKTIQDLLFHLPLRYQDRTCITPIARAQLGAEVLIQGTVQHSEVTMGRRRSLVCQISDGTGVITLRFYHYSATQRNQFETGATVRCFGEPRQGISGLEFYHPEYRIVYGNAVMQIDESLTPVYPLTEGITQARIRNLCQQALAELSNMTGLQELLPAALKNHYQLEDLADAVRFLHHPPPKVSLEQLAQGEHPAQRRLAFEELLAHNLSMQQAP